MSNYELVYILQPDLDEEALKVLNDRIQQAITTNGGEITSVESMGRRTLAYPIKRRREGTYMLVKAALAQTTMAELERFLRLSEDVLRYMLVRLDEPHAAANIEGTVEQ